MTTSSMVIRPMSRPDLDVAVDWAALEGWNPGVYDAGCFYQADPEGFLIGTVDNEPVACISVVKYSPHFGFLGFFIVKEGFRGRGYGLEIWNAGLARLKGCTIGLDGVVAQQDNYRKSGFVLYHQNIRYQGRAGGYPLESNNLVLLKEIPFGDIVAYDLRFFRESRTRFLRCWLFQPESIALGYLDKGRLSGYGMIRKCRQGYKIGPLFSDNAGAARNVFHGLVSRIPEGESYFLDIPAVNPAALALANEEKMTAVFSTARMYAGTAPTLPLEKIYGITSFELG